MKHKFDFYTQYNQFYITSDSGLSPSNGSLDWSDNAFDNRLESLTNMLVIFSGSYGHIKGEINVLDSADTADLKDYEHVVEGDINIVSGVLEFLDCPYSKVELKINVQPGKYRARIYSANLSTTDGDEYEGNDYYRIDIWPVSHSTKVKVLKQYGNKWINN